MNMNELSIRDVQVSESYKTLDVKKQHSSLPFTFTDKIKIAKNKPFPIKFVKRDDSIFA